MRRITIEGGRGTFDCPVGDTLLRAALRARFGMPYECNAGSCGECKFQLIEGELEPSDRPLPGLTERDRARGRALACQAIPQSDCIVRILPEDRYIPTHAPVRQAARLEGFGSVTGDIDWFDFRTKGPANFLAGQYALLRLPRTGGWRSYSMANRPNPGGLWRFMIRRVTGGEASRYLFDERRLGDVAELDGPFGMAFHRPRSAAVVCIAGGSGIAPALSIAQAASADLECRRLVFFYGARTPADLCAEHHLVELCRPGLEIVHHGVVSDIGDPGSANWTGPRGFLHEHVGRALEASHDAADFYVAGPPPMVEAVNEVLTEKFSTPRDRIHFDRFF